MAVVEQEIGVKPVYASNYQFFNQQTNQMNQGYQNDQTYEVPSLYGIDPRLNILQQIVNCLPMMNASNSYSQGILVENVANIGSNCENAGYIGVDLDQRMNEALNSKPREEKEKEDRTTAFDLLTMTMAKLLESNLANAEKLDNLASKMDNMENNFSLMKEDIKNNFSILKGDFAKQTQLLVKNVDRMQAKQKEK